MHKRNKKNILCQTPPDYYYLNIFSNKNKNGQLLFGIYPIIFFPKKSDFILILPFLLRVIINYFRKKFWLNKYKKIGINVFRTSLNVKDYFLILNKTCKTFLELKSPNNILKIKIDDIDVGDLIYDTYLRFYNKPTITKIKLELFFVIYQAFKLYFKLENINKQLDLKQYNSSYCSYINHGIPVRFFLNKGIKVCSSGNIYEIKKTNRLNDYYHTKKIEIKKLDDFQIEKGISIIKSRVDGHYKLPFMKKNIYKKNMKDVPALNKLDGILFLHDFFDSPHIFEGFIFNDFFQWTLHTLNLISYRKLKIGIKPHPNQIKESRLIIEKLKNNYSTLNWIDEDLSNSVIMNSRFKFGISVYGSVIGELAYHNKFSVSCSKNNYEDFGFSIKSRSISEYDNNIINAVKKNKKNDFKREVGKYYYLLYEESIKLNKEQSDLLNNRYNYNYNKRHFEKFFNS